MLSRMKEAIRSDHSEFGCQIKVNLKITSDMQGLAMSRSLGDNVSKPIGVIHHP